MNQDHEESYELGRTMPNNYAYEQTQKTEVCRPRTRNKKFLGLFRNKKPPMAV